MCTLRAAYTPVFVTLVSQTFISIIDVYQDQRKQNKSLLDQIQESLKAGTFQSYSLLISAAATESGGRSFPTLWLRAWHLKCQKGKDHLTRLNSADWKGTAFLDISPKRCKVRVALTLYDGFDVSYFCNR